MKNNTIGWLTSDGAFWDKNVSTAGRVISISRMGNLLFGKIADYDGVIQFSLRKQTLGENYKAICNSFTRGMHIAIIGNRWTTSSGEITIDVTSLKVVQSSCSGLPDKHNGISDIEEIYRHRHKDISVNPEAAKVFLLRSKVIKTLRRYLEDEDFIEFQTPILATQASGAIARPFVTKSNDLDKDLYLRIAPETSLKKLTTAGFDKVFELGVSFRNESNDKSHANEFTSLEFYRAYCDYQENKIFFLNMLDYLLETLDIGKDCRKIPFGDDGTMLDFSTIQTVLYRDLFARHGLPSPDTMEPSEADEIFKKKIRPNLIQPVIIEDYPSRMSPMAKRRDDDPTTCEQWQMIIGGWEIVKCYTELVDEKEQRKILEEQMSQRASGDEEAMMIDEDFLEAMAWGMPPQSGLGAGIDRLVAILANKRNLRDVIYFPMMG